MITLAQDGLDGRRAALALLDAADQGRTLDDAMDALPPGLEPRDRAFARRLAATAIRRRGTLDALIDAVIERPLPKGAIALRRVMALGLAQGLLLDTPPHAAVDTSVRMASGLGFAGMRGLVNAVLRRLLREGTERMAALDVDRLDTPDWLWDRLFTAHGAATARAVAAAQRAEAPLDLTPRDPADAPELAEELGAILLPTGSLRLPPGTVAAELPALADGRVWVQDAAAALPVRLLGPVAGRRILDLCAAPGGKTLQLAAAGALVTALDRSDRRLDRLRQNLRRTGLSADIVFADATEWQPPAPFDAVLIDAPCSATGTIRRHPEMPWRRGADDLAALTTLQDRLLARAVDLVVPGGTVVFCTCSLLPEEGEARVAAADARLARKPIAPDEIEAGLVTRSGDLRTLPSSWADRGGMDGFYAARLVRVTEA